MQKTTVDLEVVRKTGMEMRSFQVASVAGARFSSRDVEGMRRELDEMLENEGYYSGATRTNPSIYRIAGYLLTQASEFEVQGPLTGGEVEVVAVRNGEELYVTVGSDQCDRELDPIFPDKPKQMCPHPIASKAWPYEEVRDHWDSLIISSEVVVSEHTLSLHDSPLAALVNLDTILDIDAVKDLTDPAVVFCGAVHPTKEAEEKVSALGLPKETLQGVCDEFRMRFADPVLGRSIEHSCRTHILGDDLDDRRMYTRPRLS